MKTDQAYIFADPFARYDSGVSSYIKNAVDVLKTDRLSSTILAKRQFESLDQYRKRLAEFIVSASRLHSSIIVEAPESYAVTANIPPGIADIHIRLHCSSQLGAFLQGERINNKNLSLEQYEIDRAKHLSAPSYSAVIASRTLFKLPKNICCYPNPAPLWDNNSVKRGILDSGNYVLFVGRLHALKGVHWVLELAKRLPNIRFLIANPDIHHGFLKSMPPNIEFINASTGTRQDIYTRAKLVIIPSIYETASMVGIEALAVGVPIICWSHLGIAEYACAPMLTVVKPWEIDVFTEAIEKSMNVSLSQETMSSTSSILNELYKKGLRATLNGCNGHFMPVDLSQESISIIELKIKKPMEFLNMSIPNFKPPWRRKLQKLQRDPIRFFKDSWLGKFIWLPDNTKKYSLTSKTVKEINVEKNLGQLKHFTTINSDGAIRFEQFNQGLKGCACAFLYSENKNIEAQKIIEGLSSFDDFRYLRPPLLQVGTFNQLDEINPIQVINRIDGGNKKKISSIDHIVLLNPSPILVEVLRSCGPNQRTIVIVDDVETSLPDPLHTDVLIVVGEYCPELELRLWRRKIVVREREHLPLAIRRAVQEGMPKSPDMLLPLLGFEGNHREELIKLDVRFHQGIIHAKKKLTLKGRAMEDICEELASIMSDLAVTESVYLRYRSLCDQIENNDARIKFLTLSLSDGVIFDVYA